MNRLISLLILLACAGLEAGGDALVRKGMHAASPARRAGLYVAASAVLFGYGWLVNRPSLPFGSLLGVYVVFFFVIAQTLAWAVFGEKITVPIASGGALIVAGGLLITFWR